MDANVVREQLSKLQGPWSFQEVAIAAKLLAEFKQMREDVSEQDESLAAILLPHEYTEIWSEFALRLRQQIERWEQDAANSLGSRSVEARFHANFWRERLVQDVLHHLSHR